MTQNELIARNNITIRGTGSRVLMFAHGYGCDQHMWRFVTPAFTEEYQIILFDHVGSGKSDLSSYDFDKYNSLQGYANDVIEICNAFKLEDVIYVGHSVSAIIGVLAAIKSPDFFSELIMIGPSPCYVNDRTYHGGFSQEDIGELIDNLESNYLGWSSAITPAIMGNPDQPELAEELNQSFCSNDPKIAKHFAKVTFTSDNREDLKKLITPSLILQCSEDIIASEQVGQYTAAQIKNSSLHKLDATGHCPHMSSPQEVIDAVQAYLNH